MDYDLINEAKELAGVAVKRTLTRGGSENLLRASSELSKMVEPILGDSSRNASDLRKLHVIEVAREYLNVMDGKGGVDPKANRVGLRNYHNAIDGLNPGGSLSLSQQLAADMGHYDVLTDAVKERKNGGVTIGEHIDRGSFAKSIKSVLPSRGGLATTAVVAGVMAAGGANAAEIVDEMLPMNFSGEKSLCRQFGEAATIGAQIAAPVVGGVTAGPLGVVTGMIAQELIGGIGEKATDLICGPGALPKP